VETSGHTGQAPAGAELADVGRLARRLLNRAVETARTEGKPLRRLLLDHLGPDAASLPTVSATWPAYEHVNVQVGLEAWLAESPGDGPDSEAQRSHEIIGITGIGMMRHMDLGIGDLLEAGNAGPFGSAGAGGVTTTAVPSGPGGATHPCVRHGVYLVDDAGTRLAIMLQPVEFKGPLPEVTLQVAGADHDAIERALSEISRLASERSVFRGQVISMAPEMFGPGRQAPLNFLERPAVSRDQIVLPADVLESIEEQVLGVGSHASRLRASGQHLKRGVLLYGAPGTGKTHTLRYLLGQMPETTVIVLSGPALGRIKQACSVARALQPSVVVVEDVDLIAEERQARPGAPFPMPLLFLLLNEMDGLDSDVDVTFLLTTNRADVLEPALAARPGRIDLATELPLPDADARRQLIHLYQGNLKLDLDKPGAIVKRTEGVTAAFLKELLRKAALLASKDDGGGPDEAIRVTDAHLNAALGRLLDARNQLTRVLLGGEQPIAKAPKPKKSGHPPLPPADSGPPTPALRSPGQ
jgi:hypothetical protein